MTLPMVRELSGSRKRTRQDKSRWSRRKRSCRRRSRQLLVEPLENRLLLAADFLNDVIDNLFEEYGDVGESFDPAAGPTEQDYVFTTAHSLVPADIKVGDNSPGKFDLQLRGVTLTFRSGLEFSSGSWTGQVRVEASSGILYPGLLDIDISDDGDGVAVFGVIDVAPGVPAKEDYLKLDDLEAEDIGLPAFLDIEITNLELKFPNFRGNDTVNTLELDATFLGIDTGNDIANDLLSADNPLFGLSVTGSVEGLELDMDKIEDGVRDLGSGRINFPTSPIVGLGGGGGINGKVSGKLFGVGAIDAGFIVKQVMADPDGPGGPLPEASALYAAVTGSITLGKSGGFGLAFAFSELGPLQFFVSAKAPTPLEPAVTGLETSAMRLGVRFNTTIEDLQTETDFMATTGNFNAANSSVTLAIPDHDLAVDNDFRIRDAGNSAFDGDFTVLTVNGDEVTYKVDAHPGGFVGSAEIVRRTITDPLDLRDKGLESGIAPPDSIEDWEDQLDQAVTNQIEAGDDVWALLFEEVVFGGGATLSFNSRIPDSLLKFNVDFMIGTHVDREEQTAGMQILLKGEMTLLDGFVTLPTSLYADLNASVDGFDGRFLYLQDVPDLPIDDLDPLLVYRGEASFETLDGFDVINAAVNETTPGEAWDVKLELNLDNPSSEYRVGDKVAIKDSDPPSFNGAFEVIAISDDDNTITVRRDTDPGTWVGGSVVPKHGFQIALVGGVDLNIPAVTTLTLEGDVGIEFIVPSLPDDPDLEMELSFAATLSETHFGKIATANGVFHTTLDIDPPPDTPPVEVWGAAILGTDLGFIEPIGLFVDAKGLLRINSSGEAKPDEILRDVEDNPVPVALPAESFALRLDGDVDFRIDFNLDGTFAESESVFQIAGTFVLEFSPAGFNVALFRDDGTGVPVPATLTLGPKDRPLFDFGVLGFLAIREDGIAADLVLDAYADLPLDLASIDATAVFIVNTTGDVVEFKIPGGATEPNRPTGLSVTIPKAAPANPSAILAGPGPNGQPGIDLDDLITGSPSWTEGAPGAYGVVFVKGELDLLSVLDLDVSGYVLLSEDVVSLETNFNADGNFLNLVRGSASGELCYSSQGEFVVDVDGSVQLGPNGFNINGSADLEISHLDSDGIGTEGDGNFVLDVSGNLTASGEIFYIPLPQATVGVDYDSSSREITVGVGPVPVPVIKKTCTTIPVIGRMCTYYPAVESKSLTFSLGALKADAVPPPAVVLGQGGLVVDSTQDESDGDYSAGDLSLREAIELTNANPGADTIVFAADLAGTTITLTSGMLDIADDLTIEGLGADQLTISGDNKSRIFGIYDADVEPIEVEIRGLSLVHGRDLDGGGILNWESLDIEGCTFSDNSATLYHGGGIYNFGTLTVTNSTLANNFSKGNGGGIGSEGKLTVTDSTIRDNRAAQDGGGIYVSYYSLAMATVMNSTLVDNSAGRHGGGILNGARAGETRSSLWVANSTIVDNIAGGNSKVGWGGGVGTLDGNATTLHNTIVARNVRPTIIAVGSHRYGIAAQESATGDGFLMYSAESVYQRFADHPPWPDASKHVVAVKYDNGLWHYDDNQIWRPFTPRSSDLLLAAVDFTNDTVESLEGVSGDEHGIVKGYFSGDLTFSANRWGGVPNDGEFAVEGTYFARIDRPLADDLYGTVHSDSSFNLIGDADSSGGLQNEVKGNKVGVAPGLDPDGLQDHGGPTQTIALVSGSPAVDAGNEDLAVDAAGQRLTTDQRGVPFVRIYGDAVDVGAYEVQALSLVVDTAEDENDGVFSAGDLSLREAIELTNANPGADTIAFAPDLVENIIKLTSGELAITDDLTITGLGADQLAISGNEESRIFNVNNAESTIVVTVRGLSLVDGRADSGAGINNRERLVVEDCMLSGNWAEDWGGGGIYNSSSGTLTVTGSTLVRNRAVDVGGGIANSGTLTVTGSTLAHNEAGGNGGGVFNNSSATLTVTGSTLAYSSATAGGGISNFGTLTLANSLLAGNAASLGPDVRNAATIASAQYNVIQDGAASHIDNGVDGNQVGNEVEALDPRLDPAGLQDNGGPTQTIALLQGSPAIDAGSYQLAVDSNGDPLEYDQRGSGYPRMLHGTVDAGSFEVQNQTLTIDSPTVTEGTGGTKTLTFTVSAPLAVQGGFKVAFAAADGTAGASDCSVTTASPLTFSGTAGETQTISVDITTDAMVEDNEQFTITLGDVTDTAPVQDAAITTGAKGTGTIDNDDTASFTINDQTVHEDAGTMTFTVALDNPVDTDVVVDVTYTDVTAAGGGTDYDSAPDQVTFSAGDMADKTVTVVIVDDDIVEGTETFTASLSTSTALGGRSVDLSDTGTGKITGDLDADGVEDEVEALAGNGSGDGNNDGIPDSEQPHVASLPNAADGQYVTIVTLEGSQPKNVRSVEVPPLPEELAGIDPMLGCLDFEVHQLGPDGTATVELIAPNPDAPNTLYKFGPTADDPVPHWYEFHWNGTVGAERVGEAIVVHYKDGELGDNDLAADGKIVDPVIPAFDDLPYHNRPNPFDVNNDTHVTTLDVLLTINDINRNGIRTLDPHSLVFSDPDLHVDTNGDGAVSTMDVLFVIQSINQQSAAEGESLREQPPLLAAPPAEPPAVGAAEPSVESFPLDGMLRRASILLAMAAPNDSRSAPSNNVASQRTVHDRALTSFLRESSVPRTKTSPATVTASRDARVGRNAIVDHEAQDLLFAQESDEWLPSIADWRILRL